MKKHPMLAIEQTTELLATLEARFNKNMNRHPNMQWQPIQTTLLAQPNKLWSLFEMERTGGAPDVVQLNADETAVVFIDCAAESPSGRRSVCFDRDAQQSRKEHQPHHNAVEMAAEMGIAILSEEQYRALQQLGNFDSKTSSWIQTPMAIRELGGALFADFRYNTVFVYHNGAQSYYAARGFRGALKV